MTLTVKPVSGYVWHKTKNSAFTNTCSFSDVTEANVIGRDWVEITCPYNVEVVSSYKDRLWIITDTNEMYTAKLHWTVPNVI